MLPSQLEPESFYAVNFKVYRTHVCVEMTAKEVAAESPRLIVDQNIVDDKVAGESEFDIMLENVKAIVSDYDGFFIILRDSLKALYFACPTQGVKQAILLKLETHNSKFLGRSLPVVGLTKEYRLNSRMPEPEFESQYSFFDVLRLTDFGDFMRCKLAVNDRYIFEIVGDTITNQIAAERVIRIGVNRAKLRQIELYFPSGDMVRYAMPSDVESSFISQVHGIIQQQSTDSKARYFASSLIFTGKMNVKAGIIWGIEQVPSFREAYERENFETFIKEQREENFLNYNFISGFSGFTLKSFFVRFEAILGKSLKLTPALALRTEFEDQLIKFVQNPASSTIVVRSAMAGASSEEDWYSRLPKEDKGRAPAMIRLVHQSRKLFRDQLKEVLNEECFGEKIESEVLIDRMWAFLANMMQSGNIMREVSVSLNSSDKQDSEIYVRSPEHAPIISHNVGRFLNQFIDYSDATAKAKFEVLNKNFLIGKNAKFDFYESVSLFLAKVLELPQRESRRFVARHILQIEAVLNVFENLIFRKKESTIEKDLQRTVDLLRSPLYFEVLSQLMLTTEPELVYKATVIMNVIIVCLADKAKVKEFQTQILDYSTLLLRHVELCMNSTYAKQKHYSIIFICNCLIDNGPASNLMMRLIPKPLFYLVEEALGDISKWSIGQWEALFQNMTLNYNNATQQWNDESRAELLVVLRRETVNFYANYKPITETQSKAFVSEMFRSPGFKISREQEEKIIQLKWNYEEYEVAHRSLRKKFPVYKYYIEEIVDDKQNPELTVKTFRNPKKFWDELCTTLIASVDQSDKVKLFKCMILFYKAQYKVVKHASILPFLIKQLAQACERKQTEKRSLDAECEYLSLQLMFTLLENDPLHHNVRRFLDAGGLNVIRDFINTNLFEEDLNAINYNELAKDLRTEHGRPSGRGLSKILYNAKLELQTSNRSQAIEHVTFLFNNPMVNREALTPQLLHANEIIFCIRIFQQCVLATKSQTDESLLLIPKPLAKEFAFEPQTIKLFHQVLLLKDDTLLNATLDFVMISYIDKFNFQEFTENKWVFATLLARINKTNALKVAAFFEKALSSFAKIATDDKKALFEDLRTFNVNSPINDLGLYSKDGGKALNDNKALYEIFDQFPGFCLLPSYFFHVLLTKGAADFNALLFSEKYESPFLLWNRQALESLKGLLARMLAEYEKNGRMTPWETRTIHYSFADELTVGPILLRNWVFYPQYQSVLAPSTVPDFLRSLTRMLKSLLDSIRQSNHDLLAKLRRFYMITLAVSCLFKSLSVYPVEEFETIDKFLRYYTYHERDEFQTFSVEERNLLDACVINCLKVIYNSIKVENSYEQMDFARAHSLKLRILRLFQRCVRNTVQNELPVSFHQFKMNYVFLKILKRVFRINGSVLVSFKDGPQQSAVITMGDLSVQSDSDFDEPLFDVNIVLANLDIMLVKNYIAMITNRNPKEVSLTSTIREKKIAMQQKKEITEKVNQAHRSAFKRKKTNIDKESIFVETGEASPRDNSEPRGGAQVEQSPNTSYSTLSPTGSMKEHVRVGSGGSGHGLSLNPAPVPGNESSSLEDLARPKPQAIDDREVSFKIDVQETRQFDFKVAHKRMDREMILKMTNGLDLSTNTVAEVLLEIRKAVNGGASGSQQLPGSRGGTFYNSIKKLLKSFFVLWIQVTSGLSENRRNTQSMIEACFPLISFRIAILNVHIESIVSTQTGNEILLFCASALQTFRNLTYPVVELVYQLEKDSLYKRRLREELRQEVLQALVESSNIVWLSNHEAVFTYFEGLCNLLTLPVLCYILNQQSNEDILKAFVRGIHSLRMFVNKQILLEINAKMKTFVMETLETGRFGDFSALKQMEIQERTAHLAVADVYIENYVQAAEPLADAVDVYSESISALYAHQKNEAELKALAAFLLKLVVVNRIETQVGQKELDIIVKLIGSSSDLELKELLFDLLKRRLRDHPEQLETLLASPQLITVAREGFFWALQLLERQAADGKPTDSAHQALVRLALEKFISYICFVNKNTRTSYTIEPIMYLLLTISDEKLQSKMVNNLLKHSESRPELREFLLKLVKAKPNESDKPAVVRSFLRQGSVTHPLFHLTPAKIDTLKRALLAYTKAAQERLVGVKKADGQTAPEPSLNLSELLADNFKRPVIFDNINLPLFLLSYDNSFILSADYSDIIQRIEGAIETLVTNIYNFKITLSVIVMLRTNDLLSQNCEQSTNVVNLFLNSAEYEADIDCQILFMEYVALIDGHEFMKDSRVADFYKRRFATYNQKSAENAQCTVIDAVYFETLLLIMSKRQSFLVWMASEDEVVGTLYKVREESKNLKRIADVILNLAIRFRLLSEQTINGMRVVDAVSVAEIQRTNPEETIDRIMRRRFIDSVPDKADLTLVARKSLGDIAEPIALPLVYKPELEEL